MITCDKCGFGHKTFEDKAACKSWEEMQAEAKILEKCEALAREYFDGSGDVMAVAHSLRNVILARFEWVKKHGKDAGE